MSRQAMARFLRAHAELLDPGSWSDSDDQYPVIFGDSAPLARVEVYDNGTCSGAPILEVWAGEDFGYWSAGVTVESGSTTTFSAIAVSILGTRSACGDTYTYVES